MATIGRPPKKPEERFSTPARQLGRVDDKTWNVILQGVDASGQTKTAWMISTLVREAKKEIKKRLGRSERQNKKGGQVLKTRPPITIEKEISQ